MCFELDCASAMFVLGRSDKRNYLIRLSVSLYQPIDSEVLQAALDKAAQRYSFFFICFRSEGNRLLAEQAKGIPKVREEEQVSCLELWKGHENCEAKVTYTDKTIFFDYFHGVSDGKGGMEFLRYLTVQYLALKYHDNSIKEGIFVNPIQQQKEDGYRKYAKGFKIGKSHGAAYRIKGTPGPMKISMYHLSVDGMKQIAKRYGVSITELVTALLCIAVSNIQRENHKSYRQKKIRLLVPVNLRTYFPSNTMRNFTLNVRPEIDPEKALDLSAICGEIHQYMEKAVEPKKLAGQCAAAVKLYNCSLVKMLPVSAKKRLVQTALDVSTAGCTMTFSNMGVIDLPEKMSTYISDFGMAFSVKPEVPYSCSLISIKNRMCLTLLRTIKEPLLEIQVEKLLHNLIIDFERQEVE